MVLHHIGVQGLVHVFYFLLVRGESLGMRLPCTYDLGRNLINLYNASLKLCGMYLASFLCSSNIMQHKATRFIVSHQPLTQFACGQAVIIQYQYMLYIHVANLRHYSHKKWVCQCLEGNNDS